jgi:hypothetical protein
MCFKRYVPDHEQLRLMQEEALHLMTASSMYMWRRWTADLQQSAINCTNSGDMTKALVFLGACIYEVRRFEQPNKYKDSRGPQKAAGQTYVLTLCSLRNRIDICMYYRFSIVTSVGRGTRAMIVFAYAGRASAQHKLVQRRSSHPLAVERSTHVSSACVSCGAPPARNLHVKYCNAIVPASVVVRQGLYPEQFSDKLSPVVQHLEIKFFYTSILGLRISRLQFRTSTPNTQIK